VRVSEEYQGVVNHLSESSVYDEGKRFSETLVHNYQVAHKLDAKIIRVFRIFGPRMKLNDWHMIPDFINSAIEGTDLVIYGKKDFASSFCYVSDCIDAAIKLMETDIVEPVNIGSDVKVNMEDLANKIIAFIGSNSKVINEDAKLFVRPLCVPDTTKARNVISWLPIVTLDNGLEATINELRSRKGLKNFEI
jgi:nucleoside-diphosphate-sugar epimerase